MRSTFFRTVKYLPSAVCFRVSIALCIAIITGNFIFETSVVYAQTTVHTVVQSTACQKAADPTSNSLLAILLDRSGSLIYGTGSEPPTDPQGYSTSTAKALVDLWPGAIVVIPFSGTATPVLGSVTLSNPSVRANLKNSIERYPIGGSTPLAPAMQQALYLLSTSAAGSRVILITDGSPDGIGANSPANQERAIRTRLLPQFCTRGIPVGVFGLTIASDTPDGQDATHLLTDIARGTGSEYRNIEQPTDLAQAVIGLYAEWLHLTFLPLSTQNGDASLPLDSFLKQAIFITFSSDTRHIALYGPDGQPVRELQQFSDPHYVIDQLDGGGPILNGTYTVSAGNAPWTQVYVLISSTQRVQLLAPLPGAIVYTGRPVPLEAAFFDGDNILTPNQAVMTAYVVLLVNGTQSGVENTIVLTQEEAVFSGQTLVYKQAGDMQITIVGTFQGITRQASEDVQLVLPPALPPPPPVCRQGAIPCFIRQYGQPIAGAAVFLVILLFWLAWLRQAAPFGTLRSIPAQLGSSRGKERDESWSIPLGAMPRTLKQRLFHKSIIQSYEIEHCPNTLGRADFGAANFDLRFTKRSAYIRQRGNDTAIRVLLKEKKLDLSDGKPVRLDDGGRIIVDGSDIAVFSTQ